MIARSPLPGVTLVLPLERRLVARPQRAVERRPAIGESRHGLADRRDDRVTPHLAVALGRRRRRAADDLQLRDETGRGAHVVQQPADRRHRFRRFTAIRGLGDRPVGVRDPFAVGASRRVRRRALLPAADPPRAGVRLPVELLLREVGERSSQREEVDDEHRVEQDVGAWTPGRHGRSLVPSALEADLVSVDIGERDRTDARVTTTIRSGGAESEQRLERRIG